MRSGSSETARDLTAMVSRLHRRLRDVSRLHEITPSQASVLARLDRDGPASASDLARAERVRPQSIAAIVAALEERGEVERRPDPGDGRRQLIALTEATDAQIRERMQERRAWLTTALDEQFTAAELTHIAKTVALLERITDDC